MTVYQSGEVIVITLFTKDSSETLFNADSINSLKIYDSSKTLLSELASGWSNSSTGVYTYNYTLPEPYPYVIVEWTYTHGGITSKKREKIEVKYV